MDHTDVPGNNRWGVVIKEEELFASKEVLYHSQIIGAVAAETREIAQKAAGMVQVTYEDLKPILTIEVMYKSKSIKCSTQQWLNSQTL